METMTEKGPLGIFPAGPMRKFLRKIGSSGSRKDLCLAIVDALDDSKHLLFDAYTIYEEGFRDLALGRKHEAYRRVKRAVGLLRAAADKAEAIRRKAIAEGAPGVVTKEDTEYIRGKFNHIADLMEKELKPPEALVYIVPPEDMEDFVYEVDGELYRRMFQKFHECMSV